jgi:serine/threonine protein kinase
MEIDKVKRLGVGTYGSVYLVKDKTTGVYYAMKKSNNKYRLENTTLIELDILSRFDSPYIIKCEKVAYSEGTIEYLLPLMKGDLYHLLEDKKYSLKFEELRDIWWQIACGLYDLNSSGVISGDIKTSNVLWKPDPINGKVTVAIADFGMCQYVDPRGHPRKIKSKIYTSVYRPPELFEVNGKVIFPASIKADSFALGMIWIYMNRGETDYAKSKQWGDSLTLIQERMFGNDYKPIDTLVMGAPKDYRDDLKDLLMKLIDNNPAKRITVYEAVKHNFFRGMVRQPGYQKPIKPTRELSDEERKILKNYIMDLKDKQCELLFLFADIVHRGISTVDSGQHDYWNDLLPLSLSLAEQIINYDTYEKIDTNIWYLLRSLNFLIYRINLFTVARGKDDLLDLLPYLWFRDYNKMDIIKLGATLPYRDDKTEEKYITLDDLIKYGKSKK